MRESKLGKILTKEFLEIEHLQKKKSLNQISKEIGCDHKSVTNYLNLHKLEHLPPYNGVKNKKHWSWSGYEEISKTYWENVKTGARNRRISFNLKIESVWELYLKQNKKCSLSGLDIGFEASKSNSASLDRIDSKKGYEIDNVQWVHKYINQMKWDMSQEHFIEMCKTITNYQKKKKNEEEIKNVSC